jgi:hypothetical protein
MSRVRVPGERHAKCALKNLYAEEGEHPVFPVHLPLIRAKGFEITGSRKISTNEIQHEESLKISVPPECLVDTGQPDVIHIDSATTEDCGIVISREWNGSEIFIPLQGLIANGKIREQLIPPTASLPAHFRII